MRFGESNKASWCVYKDDQCGLHAISFDSEKWLRAEVKIKTILG